MRTVACIIMLLGCGVANAAGLLSDLRIEQPISAGEFTYEAQPQVKITFTLAQPSEAAVVIARHLAAADQHQDAIIQEPFPVRRFDLGNLEAGVHSVTWDGLTDAGAAVTQTQPLSAGEIKALENPQADQLTKEVPVDLFRIIVCAGDAIPARGLPADGDGCQTLAANFRRHNGAIDSNRSALWFYGAAFDSQGNIVTANRPNWRGRRYSPLWQLDQTYPAMSHGHSSDPVECYDVAVDSRDNVYMITQSIYKYAHDGNPAAWEDDADYLKYPYPIETKNVLGVRLNPDQRRRYTFGPGGGGAGSKEYGPEDVKNPGFAFRWGGMAIDANDNIFYAENEPNRKIHVFEPSGKYVRSFPTPDAREVFGMRFGVDGTLWMSTDYGVLGVDPQTGRLKQTLKPGTRYFHIGADGTIYLLKNQWVRRFTPAGEPIPFTAEGPQVREGGTALNISWHDNNAPQNASQYAEMIYGIVGMKDGSFYLSVRRPQSGGDNTAPLLHYAKDGSYLPLTLSAKLMKYQPGNVFLDSQPACVDLLVNNLEDRNRPITAEWILTDFDGVQTTGTTSLVAAASARQVLPLIVNAPQMGYYRLNIALKENGQTFQELGTQLARIRSRKLGPRPDSPFAMCWGTNFHLMALAGVRYERVGAMYWEKIEPLEGVYRPDPPEAMTWNNSIEGFRRYAERWGILLPESISYGEAWLGGSYPACRIHSYDRFYKFALRGISSMAGRGVPYYQFWNEPNFFWHVPGPFSREHFALVAKTIWNISKARDKEALTIADGDAGGTHMMEEFARFGANDYCDAAIIHYPGAQPLRFDKILAPNIPEGKVPMMRDLIAVRDQSFPGKPVWNTEEGWWQKNVSPAVGAAFVPRVYIPQIAIGVDRIWWFAQSSPDDASYLLDGNSTPYPSYVSYAAMTQLLEGKEYLGRVDLAPAAFGYLFATANETVLAVWSVQEQGRAVAINVGVPQVRIVDVMGRTHRSNCEGGNLNIKLTPQPVYVLLPTSAAFARQAARAELQRRLDDLKLTGAQQIEPAIDQTLNTALEPASITRLYYLVRAARQAVLAGEAKTGSAATASKAAEAARSAVLKKEGPDGYLRTARVALAWTEQLARAANQTGGFELGWAAQQAADITASIAEAEKPAYPGVTINAYLEPKSVRDGADPTKPLDERFKFQIDKRAGETLQLELTAWNYYTHSISGQLSARLPEGWTAKPQTVSYTVPPGDFQRFVFTVTIPADAPAGVISIGGQTTYRGQTVHEVYAQRVNVVK